MALNNYSNLKTAIIKWSKRDDVSAYVDDFIDLCEAEMYKTLRIRDMQARATASTSGRYLELPDSYIEMRRLRLISGSKSYELQAAVPESLRIISGAGIPSFYTVTTQLEFDREPDTTMTAEMQYWKQLTDLDDTDTTNQCLTRFPDIYLFGSLWALFDWAMEPDMSNYYYQKFQNAIEQANKMDAKGRIGPTPQMRIDGPTP